jgi:hypothetical protein
LENIKTSAFSFIHNNTFLKLSYFLHKNQDF